MPYLADFDAIYVYGTEIIQEMEPTVRRLFQCFLRTANTIPAEKEQHPAILRIINGGFTNSMRIQLHLRPRTCSDGLGWVTLTSGDPAHHERRDFISKKTQRLFDIIHDAATPVKSNSDILHIINGGFSLKPHVCPAPPAPYPQRRYRTTSASCVS
ncbi:uncharacterized protein LOC126575917 [Anopheles aquasalis]|uniref:uncharacterized protein LOC126575917 n=1 Tax=Anopheles aquasalis TaxID=42839 RepID=UPI00215AB794|nr:uncharacterized protein LOC126575917 [Anopheles aquasalis]